MDNFRLFAACVLMICPGLSYGMASWHQACPRSYEEWSSVAQGVATPVVQYSHDQLSLLAVDEAELRTGYQPGQEYPFNLRLHPGHKVYSHFQLVVVSDGQCGTGAVRIEEDAGQLVQTFCTHSVVNLTGHHLTVYWEAPECGCVTFLPGAYASTGELIVGEDWEYTGQQAHRICLAPEHVTNNIDTLEHDPEDDWNHILDLEYYGFNQVFKLLEDKDMIENEIESITKIYEINNEQKIEEDLEDENKLEVTDETKSVKTNGDKSHNGGDDMPCSGAECQKQKKQNNREKHHLQNKRKWEKRGKDNKEDSDDEELSDQKRPRHRTPPRKCKSRSGCSKHPRISKKTKLQAQKAHHVPLPQRLCTLTLTLLPIKANVLGSLGSRKPHWVKRWSNWRTNAGVCCKETKPTEMKDCIKTLGPFPIPWKRQHSDKTVTPEKKLSNVCQRVSQFAWEHFPKHPQFHTFTEDRQRHLEATWARRREEIMDCCQVAPHDERMACMEDVRASHVDKACQGSTEQSAEQLSHGPVQSMRGKLSQKCCRYQDEERYECFTKHHAYMIFKLQRKLSQKSGEGSNERSTQVKPWRPSRPHKGDHGADKKAQLAPIRHRCCREGKEAGIGLHRRRWKACDRSSVSFTETQDHLNSFMARICKVTVRRCCLQTYHRTIVDEPTTTTALPPSL